MNRIAIVLAAAALLCPSLARAEDPITTDHFTVHFTETVGAEKARSAARDLEAAWGQLADGGALAAHYRVARTAIANATPGKMVVALRHATMFDETSPLAVHLYSRHFRVNYSSADIPHLYGLRVLGYLEAARSHILGTMNFPSTQLLDVLVEVDLTKGWVGRPGNTGMTNLLSRGTIDHENNLRTIITSHIGLTDAATFGRNAPDAASREKVIRGVSAHEFFHLVEMGLRLKTSMASMTAGPAAASDARARELIRLFNGDYLAHRWVYEGSCRWIEGQAVPLEAADWQAANVRARRLDYWGGYGLLYELGKWFLSPAGPGGTQALAQTYAESANFIQQMNDTGAAGAVLKTWKTVGEGNRPDNAIVAAMGGIDKFNAGFGRFAADTFVARAERNEKHKLVAIDPLISGSDQVKQLLDGATDSRGWPRLPMRDRMLIVGSGSGVLRVNPIAFRYTELVRVGNPWPPGAENVGLARPPDLLLSLKPVNDPAWHVNLIELPADASAKPWKVTPMPPGEGGAARNLRVEGFGRDLRSVVLSAANTGESNIAAWKACTTPPVIVFFRASGDALGPRQKSHWWKHVGYKEGKWQETNSNLNPLQMIRDDPASDASKIEFTIYTSHAIGNVRMILGEGSSGPNVRLRPNECRMIWKGEVPLKQAEPAMRDVADKENRKELVVNVFAQDIYGVPLDPDVSTPVELNESGDVVGHEGRDRGGQSQEFVVPVNVVVVEPPFERWWIHNHKFDTRRTFFLHYGEGNAITMTFFTPNSDYRGIGTLTDGHLQAEYKVRSLQELIDWRWESGEPPPTPVLEQVIERNQAFERWDMRKVEEGKMTGKEMGLRVGWSSSNRLTRLEPWAMDATMYRYATTRPDDEADTGPTVPEDIAPYPNDAQGGGGSEDDDGNVMPTDGQPAPAPPADPTADGAHWIRYRIEAPASGFRDVWVLKIGFKRQGDRSAMRVSRFHVDIAEDKDSGELRWQVRWDQEQRVREHAFNTKKQTEWLAERAGELRRDSITRPQIPDELRRLLGPGSGPLGGDPPAQETEEPSVPQRWDRYRVDVRTIGGVPGLTVWRIQYRESAGRAVLRVTRVPVSNWSDTDGRVGFTVGWRQGQVTENARSDNAADTARLRARATAMRQGAVALGSLNARIESLLKAAR